MQPRDTISGMRIGIVAKLSSHQACQMGLTLASFIKDKGHTPLLDSALPSTSNYPAFPLDKLAQEAEALIVLGGDGTLLHVARHVPDTTPVLGINMGTLGFLTEFPLADWKKVVERFGRKELPVQKRKKLQAALEGETYHVLNDVVIHKSTLARIITLRILVDGVFVTLLRGDGLIISTPTGSTAYNLAAGGPLVRPGLDAVVLSPICSHTLTQRPMVLSEKSTITIELMPPAEEVFITLDGQVGRPLKPREVVKCTASPHYLSLVVPSSFDYFAMLRKKLGWGQG